MAATGLAQVRSTVVQLASTAPQTQLEAAVALRELSLHGDGKALVRDAGGIEALVSVLGGADESVATTAVETIACLAVDDVLSRVRTTNQCSGPVYAPGTLI